jgi:mannose-6-phosphate isomerase-like protein (cupin superfamily)
MAYGLTIDQVRQTNRPTPHHRHWGSFASLTEVSEYAMYRMDIVAGRAQQLHFYPSRYHAFVEAGEVVVRSLDNAGKEHAGTVSAGQVFALPRYLVHGFASLNGATIYLFGPRTGEPFDYFYTESTDAAAAAFQALNTKELPHVGQPTTDVREKYWGRIESIVSDDEIAAKRIFVQKGGQGSLEYHVEKRETYYIHSGKVKVGLRIGRAENRSIVMTPGESYDVRPGVMHLRIGLEDTVIIEVSTRDSDSDSYLVEDGQTYRHIDIDSQPNRTEKQEQPA